jgi:hypothetical protein
MYGMYPRMKKSKVKGMVSLEWQFLYVSSIKPELSVSNCFLDFLIGLFLWYWITKLLLHKSYRIFTSSTEFYSSISHWLASHSRKNPSLWVYHNCHRILLKHISGSKEPFKLHIVSLYCLRRVLKGLLDLIYWES